MQVTVVVVVVVVVLRNPPDDAYQTKDPPCRRNVEYTNHTVYAAISSTYHYLCLLYEYVHVSGLPMPLIHVSTV